MNEIIFKRTCPVCGKEFETAKLRKTYCSIDCRKIQQRKDRWNRKDRKSGPGMPCEYCGATIPEDRNGRTKYCSDRCKEKMILQRRAEKRRAARPVFHKECKYCKKPFETEFSFQVYCSDQCQQRAHYERKRLSKEIELSKMKKKVCPVCGKEFETATASRKYCGNPCAFEAKKKRGLEHWAKYHEKTAKEKTRKPKKKRQQNTAKTTQKRRENGPSYAERQIAKTLAMVPPIDVNIGRH